MLEKYDALQELDAAGWKALNESEKLQMVIDFHRKQGIQLPNEALHATLHCAIENQVALGDETPVKATLARLTASGLPRHDAIHAVASILGKYFYRAWKAHRQADESSYFEEIRNLNPKG